MAAPLGDMLLMPNPHDKGSLHFKGKDINVFLSKFEYHVDCAHLTEFERCEFIHLYTTVCTWGDFTWAEMRRKLSSHSA